MVVGSKVPWRAAQPAVPWSKRLRRKGEIAAPEQQPRQQRQQRQQRQHAPTRHCSRHPQCSPQSPLPASPAKQPPAKQPPAKQQQQEQELQEQEQQEEPQQQEEEEEEEQEAPRRWLLARS